MNKEFFRQTQNQDIKTEWDDVTDYLPGELEDSRENEKRERSFERISESTFKYFEKNQDGSYNFLGINPDEEMSEGMKSVIANKLFSSYLKNYGNQFDKNNDKRRQAINDNLKSILKGEILNKIDFSLSEDEVLIQEYNIDGLNFKFFNTSSNEIGAFVKDEDGVMKTRGFRDSGSDHQLKSVPGMDGLRWIKGDEWDTNTHYVQSGKVDRRIYEIFNDLQQKKTDSNKFKTGIFGVMDFISLDVNSKRRTAKGTESFEFSEKQHEFKNSEWNKLREFITKDFNKFLKVKKYGREMDRFKNLSEEEYTEWFDNRFIKNEKLFEKMEEVGMIPDFDQEPHAKYHKDNGNIHIEEFIASSKDGDKICWAMAFDRQNRIYIDDIFTPDVPVDSYGTPSEKINMGMLIYKPEDYVQQNRGLPDKYVKNRRSDGEDYEDISSMLRSLPPVQEYIKSLVRRKRRRS